jgi:rsbT co-antagonist protein RsbR
MIGAGIRPAVSQTLVSLGVALGTIATLRNLQDGSRACLAEEARRPGF